MMNTDNIITSKNLSSEYVFARTQTFIVILAVVLFTAPVRCENTILSIEHSWVREMPPGVPTLAAYMQIRNTGDTSITIRGVKSNVSSTAELHEVKMDNDLMQMRKLDSVIIEPGQVVEFKPGGMHVMLIGVQKSLKQGDEVEIEFELTGESPVKVIAKVSKDS